MLSRYRVTIAFCLLAVGGVALFAARADQPAGPSRGGDLSAFMHLKLKHSQAVLEGIVKEDFDEIAKNAQQLSLLSLESNWKVLSTDAYIQQSNDFRHAADELTAAAKKKNVDSAALAYLDVTLKCVNCHKYVRTVKKAE